MALTERYHQPKIDTTTRDFVLDKGGRLVFVADTNAVKQTTWMRIVSQFGSYLFDKAYGSKLHTTLRLINVEAVRMLARDFIVRAIRQERDLGRVTVIKEVTVESVNPRSRVNWNVRLETEFDLSVHLSS